MLGQRKPEVLVVGAGPVGLLASLALAKRGVRVQVVEREWRSGAHSYALALHRRSLSLLKELGLLEELLGEAHRVERIGFYEGGDRKAEARLATDEDGLSFLAILRQDMLERLLAKALEQRGVNILWNHQVSRVERQKDSVAVTVDALEKDTVGYAVAHTEWVVAKTTEVNVPLVIGADGHRSLIRRALNLDYVQVGDPQHFAVFEFQTDADLQHEMRVVMSDATTDVLWPLPGGYCRWSFQLEDFAAPEGARTKDRVAIQVGGAGFPMLGEEQLRFLIAQRAPWFTGSIGEINWQIAVRFDRRLASAMGRQRMWLAGDAAHMTGPVGMQSMNVGFREAYDLAESMANVLQNGESIERLETYNDRWLAEWRHLMGLAGGLQPTEATDPWIGQRSGRLLACLPASGDDLVGLADQLRLRWREH